jgi:hypothetical protein
LFPDHVFAVHQEGTTAGLRSGGLSGYPGYTVFIPLSGILYVFYGGTRRMVEEATKAGNETKNDIHILKNGNHEYFYPCGK